MSRIQNIEPWMEIKQIKPDFAHAYASLAPLVAEARVRAIAGQFTASKEVLDKAQQVIDAFSCHYGVFVVSNEPQTEYIRKNGFSESH